MNTLPWHLQLKIYKDIGIDTCRSLKIRPGKLIIPEALKESLNRSFKLFNRDLLFIDKNIKRNWDSEVNIHIMNTTKYIKTYKICRLTDSDLDYYIKLSKKTVHFTYELGEIIMHHNKEPLENYEWAQQILLD